MPKALVPLAGKPLLQWQVEKLRDAFRPDPNREDKTLFEKESQYF